MFQSIRISAQDTSTDDDNEVGVFLIQCGVEQSKQLYQALSYRISQVSDLEGFQFRLLDLFEDWIPI